MNFRQTVALPALLALALAAATVGAQSANPTGPGNTSTQKAGEAYPNNSATGTNRQTPEVVQKAQNSRPAQATKRAAKRATDATKKAGNRAAGAMRNTGENLERRLPPAPKQ